MLDSFGDRGADIFAAIDAADADRTLTAREHRQVGRGIVDHLADPLAFDRPGAFACDAILMRDIIIVAVVVGDDDEQRNIVRDGRPERR